MLIGVLGKSGRMGRLLAEEIEGSGHILAAETLPPGATETPDRRYAGLAELAKNSDAIMDFTHADALLAHAAALCGGRAAWILGTSGLSLADEARVREVAQSIPVVMAPSFAPGVTLMLALAERAAASLPARRYDAEIIEMHHRDKVDAPSGTAIGLGRAVAKGRGVVFEDVAIRGRDGHTGPRPTGGIGFASMRGGQVVGEHKLVFAGFGEHITLQHEAFDRRVFAGGAVRAAEWVHGRTPGLYTMRDVLGLPEA